MVETDKRQEAVQAHSAFKVYLQQHPEALQTLFKVITNLYVEPRKVSEVKE